MRKHVFKPASRVFTSEQFILYAVSLGLSRDPLNRDHFKFTYELEDGFTNFPTLPVIFAHSNKEEILNMKGLPQFNPMSLLHGE